MIKTERVIKPLLKSERVARLFNMLINSNLRFCFVGGISTIFNYSLFLLLVLLKINYLVSSASGYILGVFIGFMLNSHSIFESKSKKYGVELTKYFIVYTASLFAGLGFLMLLVYMGIPALVANVFAIVLTTMTNYTGCRFFVFTKEIYLKNVHFLIYRYKYLLRYVMIGLGSLFVEVFIIQIIDRFQPLAGFVFYPVVIMIIGFLGGVVFAFILNSTINFPVPKNRNSRTFRMFFIISIFAFLLNLGLIKFIFSSFLPFDYNKYNIIRFITASIVFMVSYTLHRRFTFTDIKEVGVAVYMSASENIKDISSKIMFYPDFIHIDLVDTTYNPHAEEVDLSKGRAISKTWPATKKMVHIMSRNPSKWIEKVKSFCEIIIFHIEIDENIADVIHLCRKFHKKVGISILYNTNIDPIIKYLGDVDIVQVLGIPKPGYSDQNMEEFAIEKLNILNKLKEKYHFEICFDGGVKLTNVNKINAKYIVSGSTVLKSDDAVKAIYDLKTNSRYYMEGHIDLKNYIKNEIKRIVKSADFIKSGTIVGSFATSRGLEGISDMDIIIIIDDLTKNKFEYVVSEFKKLESRIKLDYDYDTLINTTFGPLKFNKEKTAVFHLMIYDVEGHIKHCKESPFTCLDWQQSEQFFKVPLSSIYKVTALQPNHFFNARRSVKDYLADLNSNSISFREYEFKGNKVEEKKKYKKMSNQDRFEFTYHIMKFCILNFMKLHNKENRVYSLNELIKGYFEVFPAGKREYGKYILELAKIKSSGEFPKWKERDESMLKSFLNDFEEQFNKYFNAGAAKFYFIRHQKTEMNKEGVFVGQKSDPGITNINHEQIKAIISLLKQRGLSIIYSSPLKRCIQTIDPIKRQLGIEETIIDSNLLEIDYGVADGKSYSYLKSAYPMIIKGREQEKDPVFPEGENTGDVMERLKKFLSKFSSQAVQIQGKTYLVCTHNMVLRCLVGSQFIIPMHNWHMIEIPFLEPIELILARNGKFYINLTQDQVKSFFKKINFGGK